MEIEFKGKVVIITGGSNGIGEQLVNDFHEAGAKVYFTYLSSEEKAQNLCLKYDFRRIEGHRVDNKDCDSIKKFLNYVGEKEKKIDVLVNNAGVLLKALAANTSLKDWENIIQTNLTSIFVYSSIALRYLFKSGSASIINISSLNAIKPTKGVSAYAAAKGGVEAFSKVIMQEYASFKIRVNTVAPGLVDTQIADLVDPEFKKRIIKNTPLRRLCTTKDVSNAVMFLASDFASFITGEQILLTGGRHI